MPLPAFLEQEIEAHLRSWGVTSVGGRDVLFARGGAAAGTMPTATTYGADFRPAVRAAGFLGRDRASRYTPHTLRHFFASIALAHGVPLHEVSRWLGHASIKTTVDISGHLVPAAWERCRQALQQALGPAPADAPAAAPAVAHRTAPASGSSLDPVGGIRARAGHSACADVSAFFCGPGSPWQRGSNENANVLLQQYFLKGTDLPRTAVNNWTLRVQQSAA